MRPLFAEAAEGAYRCGQPVSAAPGQGHITTTMARLAEFNAACSALEPVDAEVHAMQTTQLLVLGARINDQEAVVPPV